MFVDVPLNEYLNSGRVSRICADIHRIFAPIDVALQPLGFMSGGNESASFGSPGSLFCGMDSPITGMASGKTAVHDCGEQGMNLPEEHGNDSCVGVGKLRVLALTLL